MAALVSVAFALGALAGLGLPSVIGGASHQTLTARPATLVAGQTMDDARRAALYGAQTTIPAGQTMDDARRAALYGSK